MLFFFTEHEGPEKMKKANAKKSIGRLVIDDFKILLTADNFQ